MKQLLLLLLTIPTISMAEDKGIDWRIEAQSQAAGTPNQAGIGTFIPLGSEGFYFDGIAKASFSDIGNESSLKDTKVSGIGASSSLRLGQSWSSNNYVFDINAGYDTRYMKTGNADNGVNVIDKKNVFYHQLAYSAAVFIDETLYVNAYGLTPVGSTKKDLNNTYEGIALHTYGLDMSYVINNSLNTVLGYYYQDSDTSGGTVGSGVKAGLDYKINDQLALAPNISYDNGFNTRFSLNLTYQFGTTSDTFSSLRSNNRDIRVYDPQCNTKTIILGINYYCLIS